MAMSHSAAKAAVLAQINSVFGPIPSGLLPAEQAALTTARSELADSIAQFVDYIQANAVVPVTVASVAGVMPGSGISGAGTGTGTVT